MREENRQLEHELTTVSEEREILRKATAFFARENRRTKRLSSKRCERAEHHISTMCQVLNISRSAFYKTCDRKRNPRILASISSIKVVAALTQEIKLVYENSKGRYGSRKVYHALKNMNQKCSRRRVERLMQENGLQGKHRRSKTITTISKDTAGQDLIRRDFNSVKEPNQRWVSDIPYISTWVGFVYLCVFLIWQLARWLAGPNI